MFPFLSSTDNQSAPQDFSYQLRIFLGEGRSVATFVLNYFQVLKHLLEFLDGQLILDFTFILKIF